MLLGEYEHTLDDKNRLTLPAKVRQALGGGVVVTRGMDGCLFVFTREGWDEFVVAGVRDHVEIWDRAAWRKQLKEVEGSVELVAERLAAKQD